MRERIGVDIFFDEETKKTIIEFDHKFEDGKEQFALKLLFREAATCNGIKAERLENGNIRIIPNDFYNWQTEAIKRDNEMRRLQHEDKLARLNRISNEEINITR